MQARLTTISEIHAYPSRPDGYVEPLFHSLESRKAILEHFTRSGWLWRASEQAAPAPGQTGVPSGARAGSVGTSVRVISRWREVDRWWEPGGGVDVVWSLVELDRGGERVLADPPRNGESHEVRTLRTAA